MGPFTTSRRFLVLLIVAALLSAGAAVAQVPPPGATFSGLPRAINADETSTLSWTTTNATSVVIDNGIGNVALSGSVVVSPCFTTTYTLTATGPGGQTIRTFTLSVTPAANAPGVTFTANPTTIIVGQSSTLTWSTTGARTVQIDNGVGNVALSGSVSVSPTKTTTYRLTATGCGGTTASSVTVVVNQPPPPVIDQFFASPPSITEGLQSELFWKTTNASSVTIDEGIGAVGPTGSVRVSPAKTTTYTLTASGSGGVVTKTATITVTPPAPPAIVFNATPQTIVEGEQSRLTWATSNATDVTIDNGVGSVPASGSAIVAPRSTTTYTITAMGPGGSATARTTVTVADVIPPPAIRFTVTPASINEGDGAILSWVTTSAASVAIDNGIGSVAPSGSRRVAPLQTTTWKLTAAGSGGSSTASVTLEVRSRQEKPDLIAAVTLLSRRLAAGESFDATAVVANRGRSLAGASTLRLLLSSDANADASDVLLLALPVPAVAARATESSAVRLTIPAGTSTGRNFVIAQADALSVVDEIDETNNSGFGSLLVDPQPEPPKIAVSALPRGMVQVTGSAGGTDSYVLTNVSHAATSITLTQSGSFFTQSPERFDLAEGQSQLVVITALPQSSNGIFDGVSIPAGNGVPADLRIPIRLLSGQRPASPPVIVPVSRRIEIVAPAEENPVVQIAFTNIGGSPFEGYAVSDVAWIVPAAEILRIDPGATRNVTITILRANRPDADALLGGVTGLLGLQFLSSAGSGLRKVTTETNPNTNVTVVDVVKVTPRTEGAPPIPPGEVAFFVPGIAAGDSAVTDLFLASSTVRDVRLFFSTPGGTQAITAKLPSNLSVAFPAVAKTVFGSDVRAGSLQIRTGTGGDIAIAGVQLATASTGVTKAVHLPPLRSDLGAPAGERIVLAGIGRTTSNTARAFVQEVAGFEGTVRIEFLDESGNRLGGPTQQTIGPFSFMEVFDIPNGTMTARIENISTTAARFGSYAVVTEASDVFLVSDITRAARPAAESHVIPLVSASGELFVANNTAAPTEVVIETGGSIPVRRRAVPRATGNSSLGAATDDVETFSINADATKRADLDAAAAGYGIISAPAGAISASGKARSSGGARASLASAPTTNALAYGKGKLFVGVDDAVATSTSLILIETAGETATARVSLRFTFPAGGKISGVGQVAKDFAVNPRQMLVIDELARAVIGAQRTTLPDLRNMQVEVEVVSGSGRLAPFVQSVDTVTGALVIRGE